MRVTEIHSAGKPRITTTGDGRILIVLTIAVLKRSARKQIFGPTRNANSEGRTIKPTALQLALIRGHRWLELLDCGKAGSIKEIAAREYVDPSLVSRLVNLTTLAPAIIETILADKVPPKTSVLDVSIDPPLNWQEQLLL